MTRLLGIVNWYFTLEKSMTMKLLMCFCSKQLKLVVQITIHPTQMTNKTWTKTHLICISKTTVLCIFIDLTTAYKLQYILSKAHVHPQLHIPHPILFKRYTSNYIMCPKGQGNKCIYCVVSIWCVTRQSLSALQFLSLDSLNDIKWQIQCYKYLVCIFFCFLLFHPGHCPNKNNLSANC